MNRPKRGLVLEGGGAKGAYAFGCLKAFREAGIEFDAVSGTSVGALNAVLWATDEMQLGERYWGELRPGRVFKWRAVGLLMLPLFLLRWLAFVAIQKTAAVRLSLGKLWGEFLRNSAAWTAFLGVGWLGHKVTGWGFLNTYVGDLALGIAASGGWATFQTVPFLLDRAGITLLAPRPLRGVLNQILRRERIKLPVYATLAEQVERIDPDRPVIVDTSERRVVWTSENRFAILPSLITVPRYVRLDELNRSDRVSAVLASAALPEGIFPPVTLGGQKYRDGGVIDNLPVLPLVSIEECEEIVVVQLRPREEAQAGSLDEGYEVGYLEHWQRVDRLNRLRDLSNEEALARIEKAEREDGGIAVRHPDSNKLFPYSPQPGRPRFITIAPGRSLGNFVSGTMRFDADSAREWMREGYEDAARAIRNNWNIELPSAGPSPRSPEIRPRAETDRALTVEEANEILLPAFGWAPVPVESLVAVGALPTVWRSCEQRILRSEVERFRRRLKRQRIFARLLGVAILGYGIYTESWYIGVGAILVGAMMAIGGYTSINVHLKGTAACLGCVVMIIVLAGLIAFKTLLQ